MKKYTGTHIKGLGRGKTLGFPTINLTCQHPPEDGVYLGNIEGKTFQNPGVIHIGSRPTFGLEEKIVEIHLLNWRKDISTGGTIIFTPLKKIREVQKFTSPQELIFQITKDIEESKKHFENIAQKTYPHLDKES